MFRKTIKSSLLVSISAICIIFASSPSTTFADSPWVLNPNNRHYYKRIDIGYSWEQSKIAAERLIYQGHSCHLATITSSSEQNFIVNNLGRELTRDHWIGAYQYPSGRTEPWTWITAERWGYTNWAWWEPDGPTDKPSP